MTTAELGQKWLDAWNSGSPAAIVALFAEGGTFNDPILKKNVSTAELAGYAQVCMAGFPDLRFTTLSVTADAEKVVIEWDMTATNTGSFLGAPPSGKSIKVPGVSLIRAREGKITSAQDYWDVKLFLDQLGMRDLPM